MPNKKGKKDKPDKKAKKELKDFLKARKQQGKTKQEWNVVCEALIPDAEDLDNAQITERLRDWMRTFPKADSVLALHGVT